MLMYDKNEKSRFPYKAAVILLAVIAAALVCVVLVRQGVFDGVINKDEHGSEIYFEANKSSVFGTFEDGIAIVSSLGVSYYTKDGDAAVDELIAMSNPALTCGKDRAIAYDIDGNDIVIFSGKEVLKTIKTDKNIISASMNKNGWWALATQEEGYRGSLTAYNSDSSGVYKWSSGEGYLYKGEISPSNNIMAAVTYDGSGSRVVLMDLGSENSQREFRVDGEVILDIDFISANRLAVISENAVYIIDMQGAETASYSYDGRYLKCYSTGGNNFIALYLQDYQIGTTGCIAVINYSGEEKSSVETDEELTSLSAAGNTVAAVSGSSAYVYNDKLELLGSKELEFPAYKVFARNGGSALVVYPYTAEIFKPE